jgi:hypothetical protein
MEEEKKNTQKGEIEDEDKDGEEKKNTQKGEIEDEDKDDEEN